MDTLTTNEATSGGFAYYFKKEGESFKLSDEALKDVDLKQLQAVKAKLQEEKILESSRIESEVDWFYGGIRLHNNYFHSIDSDTIASHISSFYAAKIFAATSGHKGLNIALQSKVKDQAFFACSSDPGRRISKSRGLEQNIEKDFLGEGYVFDPKALALPEQRMASYLSKGPLSPGSPLRLRLYFISACKFPETDEPIQEGETDLEKIADETFLQQSTDHTKQVFQEILTQAVSQSYPVVKVFPAKHPKERRLVVCYKRGTVHSFFSGLTDLYRSFNLFSTHKYCEQFANGYAMYNIYLSPPADTELPAAEMDKLMQNITNHVAYTYVLPRTSLSTLFQSGELTIKEYAYSYAAWKFAYQFLFSYASEYSDLASLLSQNVDASTSTALSKLKMRLRKDTFTESRVKEAILEYPMLVKLLYNNFKQYHQPGSSIPLPKKMDEKISEEIEKTCQNDVDVRIFKLMLQFNGVILKTNFYKRSKVALSFRLEPSFLADKGYPNIPFGIFFIVGAEFRGFHIRFRDVSRGGIRVIQSQSVQAFVQNVGTVFEECYNLASTQQKKNKDLPEGGSKGTILLSLDQREKVESAFKKYIDSLLDVILVEEDVVDHHKKEEILFLGPDEGSAELMDWASSHAKSRGYPFWKGFTTGKSLDRGGIPHDLYGMTTRSVHQYVLGIYEKLGLKEGEITKVQTGGPDGDLGSNEIKISSDKTKAIIDGSGVVYDPDGLDRTELLRLAEERLMSRYFNPSKLGKSGFFVDVKDTGITLPDGTQVTSGLQFRNTFHLNPLFAADLFVPCGGRPESIQLGDVQTIADRFKYIVEGANLFLTQDARVELEKRGIHVFKDASTNKGGVTSSSLEVLAALSFTDEQFEENMCIKDNKIPLFYQEYIKAIHVIIEKNSRNEFSLIWDEYARTKTSKSVLSDRVSEKINVLNDKIIEKSGLWDDMSIRTKILERAIPKTLLNVVPLETLYQRVPEVFLKAIFSSHIASHYVYQNGLLAAEFDFWNFMNQLLNSKV